MGTMMIQVLHGPQHATVLAVSGQERVADVAHTAADAMQLETTATTTWLLAKGGHALDGSRTLRDYGVRHQDVLELRRAGPLR